MHVSPLYTDRVLSRYTSSMYEVKNLKEVLYDTEEDLRPRPWKCCKLYKRICPRTSRGFTPPLPPLKASRSYGRNLDTRFWIPLLLTTLIKTSDPRPATTTSSLATGPTPTSAPWMTNLAAQDKPWAVLIPTQCLTHPKSELWGISGLQLIAPVAWREFPRRSQRNVPLHFLWVTRGLGLPKDLVMVELPPLLEEDPTRTPAEINITRLSLRTLW